MMLQDLTTRRVFMQRGLAILAAAGTVPTFLDQTVLALSNPDERLRTQAPSGKDGKILVVVQLAGGNDGLNTIIPYGDDAYHKARPGLRFPVNEVLKIDDYLGLNPGLAPIKELYDSGLMQVVQGVGYPNPNRSHFRAMDIWHSAQPEKQSATTGWLGRFFDNTCPGEDPHAGVSIGGTLPLAMQGSRITPLSFDRPENYRYNGRDKEAYLELNSAKAPATQPAPTAARSATTAASELDFLHRTAMDAQLSSDDILRLSRTHQSPVDYPRSGFGNALRTVAAMIAGGLPTRVYYVSLGGFDTHAQQRGKHDQLMAEFANGIAAFMKDLKHQKNDQRVLTMTFSEFGRRVSQNASNGTDHGAAAPMFLFGPSVTPGLIGPHPSLTKLDQGDLIYNVDFRNVYATVLQGWLDTPSKPILGHQFKTMGLLKA